MGGQSLAEHAKAGPVIYRLVSTATSLARIDYVLHTPRISANLELIYPPRDYTPVFHPPSGTPSGLQILSERHSFQSFASPVPHSAPPPASQLTSIPLSFDRKRAALPHPATTLSAKARIYIFRVLTPHQPRRVKTSSTGTLSMSLSSTSTLLPHQ